MQPKIYKYVLCTSNVLQYFKNIEPEVVLPHIHSKNAELDEKNAVKILQPLKNTRAVAVSGC